MDASFTLALIGLFLFLSYKYQEYSFSKKMDTFIEEAARTETELEAKLQSMSIKVIEYDRISAELEVARQTTRHTIPLEHHLDQLDVERFANGVITSELEQTKRELEAVKGKQISERVRLGQVSENVAPLLNGFPYDSKRVRGLFNPIDLVVFNDDSIVFVEIKTGSADLTTKQRNIKRLVEEGKVRFEIHRMSQEGYEIV
jgi:predicted Holliday junction resolvase-like endonuclease